MGPSQGWNILIIIATIGGLLGLYFLTYRLSSKPPEDDGPGHVWDEDLTELHNPLPRWWVGMFYLTIVFAVVYLALYPGMGSLHSMLGWTQTKQYERELEDAQARYGPLFERYRTTPIPDLAADPKALGIGRRLFSAYCATCHGSDARGVKGFPDLSDRDWLYGGDPDAIEASILNGRTGVMPGWRGALGSDAALAEVTEYVLGLSAKVPPTGGSSPGKVWYDQLCTACHGADGAGNPLLGAPSLSDDIWLYGGRPEEVAASIADGRQGYMPAHGKFLGEAKVHLLAAYVYSLSQPRQ